LALPFGLLVGGCGGSTGVEDDDASAGDDDASVGDDDDSGGDDDASVGDDDSGGDDDASGSGDDDSPWEQTTGFYVSGSFPQDGALGVPQDLFVQFFFSEPFAGDVADFSATLTGTFTQTVQPLVNPVLGEDQMSVGYAVSLWPEDRTYTLHLEVKESPYVDARWPLSYDATFKTSIYCGQTFDIFRDLAFVSLGANEDTASQLNALLALRDPAWTTGMILEGIPQNIDFPVTSFDAGIAGLEQVVEDSDIYGLNHATGVTSQIKGMSIDRSGAMEGSADRAVFPLQLNSSSTVYVYLYGVELAATVQSSGNLTEMRDFLLSGVMLGNDVFNLLNQFGIDPEQLQLALDVDTDGDGFPDSATVKLESDPVMVELVDCAG
jgi:hypothetical protein